MVVSQTPCWHVPVVPLQRPLFSGGLEDLACEGGALLSGAALDGVTSLGTETLMDRVGSCVARTCFPSVERIEDLDSETLCRAGGKVIGQWLSKLVPGATSDGMGKVLLTGIEALGKLNPNIGKEEGQALNAIASRAMVHLYGQTGPFTTPWKLGKNWGGTANQALFVAHWRLFHLFSEAAKQGSEQRAVFLKTFIRKDYPGSKADQYAGLLVQHALRTETEIGQRDSLWIKEWLHQYNDNQRTSRKVLVFFPKLAAFVSTVLGGPEAWLGAAGVILAKRIIFRKRRNSALSNP